MNNLLRNRFIMRFGVSTALLLSHFTTISQNKNYQKQIIQSPYYDAIVLYYALQNCNAYILPVAPGSTSGFILQNVDKPVLEGVPTINNRNTTVGGSQNPLFGGSEKPSLGPVKKNEKSSLINYTIIESATGKILLDNFSGNIDSLLKSDKYKFKDSSDRNMVIREILARNANTNDISDTNIKNLYKANTYLSVFFSFDSKNALLRDLDDKINFNPSNLTILAEDDFSRLGGAGLSLGSLIAQGYTDYLIDAVNTEVNDAFFIHLQNVLTNSKYPEFKILFPTIVESLAKIKITEYNQSLNTLKSAYKEDIKNILSNTSQLASLERYQNLVNEHPELTLVFVTCDLISLIKQGNTPADILFRVNSADYIQKIKPNIYSSGIKLAALISYCLRDIKMGDNNTNAIGWVDQSKINMFKNSQTFFKLFMGLFAQNAKDIIFPGEKAFDFQDVLFKNSSKVIEGQFIVYNFSKTISNINNYIYTATGFSKNESPTKFSNYALLYSNIASQIIDLANNCLAVLPSSETNAVRKEIQLIKQKYIPILTQANTVMAKIEEQDYQMVIYETDTLLRQLIFDSTELMVIHKRILALNNNLHNIQADSVRNEIIKTIAVLKTQATNIQSSIDNFITFEEKFIKYGSFIASVAVSKKEDDIKMAIKAFALPKGSSRIKKEHIFSLGLNSYVGAVFSGKETRITAPFGLAMSFGLLSNKRRSAGSLSIYGGIIDVGAIFTYKVNTDSSLSSEIKLSQILSPSIGLILGLPIINKYNIPLSIGFNSQWGPKLQKVDQAGNSVLPLLAKRCNLFLAIDIPFVNFHVSKD